MGLRLKIEGNETINLRETSIMSVQFGADIPHDSNARSTDLGSTVEIKGKILAAVFTLLLKQKKDKMANMKFEGGFSGE